MLAPQVALTKLNEGEQPELKNQLGVQGALQLVQIKSATSQVVAGAPVAWLVAACYSQTH